jgi:hypothetical protein
MSLVLEKISDDRYTAQATPPHVRAAWSTTDPLPVRRLIEELRQRGAHQRDIGDALYEQDPNWVEKLT